MRTAQGIYKLFCVSIISRSGANFHKKLYYSLLVVCEQFLSSQLYIKIPKNPCFILRSAESETSKGTLAFICTHLQIINALELMHLLFLSFCFYIRFVIVRSKTKELIMLTEVAAEGGFHP